MELLGKISVKSVYGSINVKELHEKNEPKQIMRVLGVVNATKLITTNFGDSIAFIGNVKAINLETGQQFGSGKAFLPNIAANLVEGALNGENNNGIQFAFDVGVKPVMDRQNKPSYEYTVTPLMETQDNDPLSLLEKQISEKTPLKLADKSADTKAK